MAGQQSDNDGYTLTVLGCGTMGIAILGGIMDSLTSKINLSGSEQAPASIRLPTKFKACVRSQKSAKRIESELSKYNVPLDIHVSDSLPAVRAADIIILGCKPYMVKGILSDDEMRHAMRGKLIISICAGVTVEAIDDLLGSADDMTTIVRVMPSTASKVRQSMTVIAASEPPLKEETTQLVEWIFTRVGRVATLPASNMDAATALCGSGPAFMALVLEALADGAVAMGIPRAEALMMAAQTMKGTTELVLSGGEHPAVLKDKVSTPGGCTIGGLMVLEEGAVRGSIARAVREATVVASQLGEGKKLVNGTRH